jgi:hypothetical protein
MKAMVLETVNKRTGEVYLVIDSPRGRYFGLVPKGNPAQKPIRFARSEFTKPVWKAVG